MQSRRYFPTNVVCFAFGLLLAGLEEPAIASLRGISLYQSPRANLALDFLNKLETGNVAAAYAMLSAGARRAHPISALKAPRRNPTTIRKVIFDGPTSQYEVRQEEPGQYYIVCIIDAPKGPGAVTNIAVTVVTAPDSQQWRVADYRYDSRLHPACASRL